MPAVGEWYICPVCYTVIQVIAESDVIPFCCDVEMELLPKKTQNGFITDKNVCGAVMICKHCGLEALMHQDGGGILQCCMKDMQISLQRHDRETGKIYRCTSCKNIIKIDEPGCGPLHCCDSEVCVMDIDEVREITELTQITMEGYQRVPYDERRLFCPDCGRVLLIMKAGKGTLICHDKPMGSTIRYGFYFQVGG